MRTHRILWTGWVETARVQASYGINMNFDYYHWGPLFQNKAGEWVNGYLTGSGLPMKFIDAQGRILKIFQQLTHLADDHLLNLHWGGVVKIRAEAALEVARTLLDRSLAGQYSAITGHFHIDPFAVGGEWLPEAIRWLEGTLDYAVTQDIPIWSAEEWSYFTELRHDANLENIEWSPTAGRMSLRLRATNRPSIALTVMVPLQHGERRLSQVEVNGLITEHAERKVGGVSYGWITIPAGSHYVIATYV